MTNGLRRIYDVIARIDGKQEPDREVILGTHHDAWSFGGVDPGSAAASVLELARAFSEMRKSGWQPRRSIVFAFWDAEEYGLIGSTEYAEDRGTELRERAVAYINTDYYLAGRLEAGGTASLRDLVDLVAGEKVESRAPRQRRRLRAVSGSPGPAGALDRVRDPRQLRLVPLGLRHAAVDADVRRP